MIVLSRPLVPGPRLERIMQEKRVALALGGGAARGCAHIGVLRGLEELGISVDAIAGTSMGAMIGGIYAAGHLEELESYFLEMDWRRLLHFFDVVFPHSGLIDGKHILEFLEPYVGELDVGDLEIPFLAVTTDLETGQEVLLDEGNLATAIRSSISVPGLLTPIRREGRLLVDGGLVDPVPVGPARRLSNAPLVAVELNRYVIPSRAGSQHASMKKKVFAGPPEELKKALSRLDRWLSGNGVPRPAPPEEAERDPEEESKPRIPDVLSYSTLIMQDVITDTRLAQERPDVVISPQVGDIGFMAFDRAEEAIRAGRDETLALFDGIL